MTDQNLGILPASAIDAPKSPTKPETSLALSLLIDDARRASLLKPMTLLILGIQKRGYQFSDLILAFADYAESEASQLPEISQTWLIVSSFLKAAARKLKTKLIDLKSLDKSLLDSPLAEVSLSDLVDAFNRSGRTSLLKTVSDLALVIYSKGYHFSELILTLVDLVEIEIDKAKKKKKSSWKLVKSYLEAAAREAEAKGRELP